MVRSFLLEDATQDTTMSAADTDSSSFSPPFLSEPKGYALSGKIMLSAIIILFAIVVIMVCLHIYARWYILRARRRNVRRARRRTHLVFYIEPNDPSNIVPFPTRGLDASVIKSLPTFVYAKNSKVAPADVEDGEVLECAVCLSEFEEREMGRMLPKCSHCFHVECIDMWLHSHDTCPICRSPVDPADLPSSDIEEGGVKSVELGELTQSTQSLSQLGDASESRDEVGPSRGPSSSFGGRRKGVDFVGVTIEVPRRCHSFSFTNSDESGPSRSPGQAFRSPTSRILSLKRILSREKKSPLPSPSPSPSPSASRAAELDVELGRVDPATPASQG